jgi:cyclopropane-fatty-acyl-phospholipid synthase
MAEMYPQARITAVSNSSPQRLFIESVCREKGIGNVHVVTTDMNHFETDALFERFVSVEMFEHIRNYKELLHRVARWLKDDGRLFVHIFCHRELSYLFETDGEDDWMGRYFFTGSIMPSDHLLFYFNCNMVIEDHWRVCGTHYQQTYEDWLRLQDSHREQIMPIMEKVYADEAGVWFQ